MDRASAPVGGEWHAVSERVWWDGSEPSARGRRAPARSRRAPLRELLFATTVLAFAIASAAFAGAGDGGGGGGPSAGAARDEGDPVALGRRNPRSGTSSKETAIEAKRGKSGLALRTANKAKGGRGLSASCNNSGTDSDDGCGVFLNKGTGVAATFRTDGSVPFAISDTANGLVQNLNADRIDGLHATDFLLRSEASSFLAAGAKAADANTLDGKDSGEFLGSTAKAADAQVLDGIESDDFARVSGLVNGSNGNPLSTGITSVRNAEGDYTVTINDGTFSNSGTSCSLLRPVISPVGNEFHAAVWNEAGCLIGGGAQFDVLTFDAGGVAEDATFGFIVDVVP